MAEFYEVMFLFQLAVLLILTLYKIYNMLTFTGLVENKDPTELSKCWVIFMITTLCFGVGMFTYLVNATNTLMLVVFEFERLFFMLNVIFIIIETLVSLSKKAIMITEDRSGRRQ